MLENFLTFARRSTFTVILTSLVVLCAGAQVAQAASPGWKILGATGPTNVPLTHSETQQVAVDATGGTFTLTFGGQTTDAIPYDATPSAVQSALQAVSSIGAAGGTVTVAGGPGDFGGTSPYTIAFGGSLADEDVAQMTSDPGLLARFLGSPSATVSTPTDGGAGGLSTIAVYAINVGGVASSGTVTATVTLPSGITTSAVPSGQGWSCTPATAGQSSFTCTSTDAVAPSAVARPIKAPILRSPSTPGTDTAHLSISGGGASGSATYDEAITGSSRPASAGVAAFVAGAYDADGNAETQAGAHPYSATTMFLVNTVLGTKDTVVPAGDPRDIKVDLPPGFVGNPLVTPRCPITGGTYECSTDTIVGVAGTLLNRFGVETDIGALFNDTPPVGSPAEFAFNQATLNVPLVASVRSGGDYGVTITAPNTSQAPFVIYGATVTIWGTPAAAAHDTQRCVIVSLCSFFPKPSTAVPARPLLSNPTDCPAEALAAPVVGFSINSWQSPGVFDTVSAVQPAVTGCDQVPFEPSVSVTPTSSLADSASGLDVDISVPQDGLADPSQLATASLKKAVVQLPEGVSVNPSAATGLDGCSDDQVGINSLDASTCPDGSKIGTATIDTPLLDQRVTGDVYLGTPKSTDPTSGEMFRLFIVARNDRYGVSIKLPGSAVADPLTGRLTATFDNNPKLPFTDLKVTFKGGSRGILAMPQQCQTSASTATLTPWSGSAAVTQSTAVTVGGDCSFGFHPTLAAGMSSPAAGGSGTFSFNFARTDGEQWLQGLTAQLPTGLLASVRGIPLCGSADAAAGTCPAASRIGSADASAGSGDPFVLQKKGDVYLTEGYKGCPYGLAVRVPVEAGPFTGALALPTIVVRQSVCVDPIDAHVTVTSDPLPTIDAGIPLRVRTVTVAIDRPGFMLNPTDCTPKAVTGTLGSAQGATAAVSSPFAAAGCGSLELKPKLALSLTGKGQTTDGKHPGVDAVLTQAGGQANLKKVEVRLPLSLALDPDNAQGLCEFVDGSKVVPTCPATSIVGSATAVTPILNQPLTGPVYFVKNIRIDAKTGRQIKTLPKLVVPLVGENGLRLTLTGTSAVPDNKHLVTTFEAIPDAPVSRFELKVDGGKHGILAVSDADVCKATQIARQQVDGQNGKQADADIMMGTPCGLGVVAASHGATALKLTVGGIGAGKVTVSGKGINKTSRTIKNATTVSLAPKLTAAAKRTLARHRDVKVKITVTFTPAGAKKAITAHKTLVIHGTKAKK
ncbi:MAG TPA: hypothetical protein VGO10_05195 [Baekduia sp.]|jgi:hypothetical protein|nr:hypothetical protein [Baekduia sp.]